MGKRAANRNATRKAGPTTRDPLAPEGQRYRRDPWAWRAWLDGLPVVEVEAGYRGRCPDLYLGDLTAELHELDARRVEVAYQRVGLVRDLRRQGWTWDRLATAAGVSRTALIRAVGRA